MEGFGKELETKADAIFLDLPHPWLAIDHAVVTLKKSGTNCSGEKFYLSFSVTMNLHKQINSN